MKHFIFSLFLVAFTLPSFASNIPIDPPEDGVGPKLSIWVEFGRKSKDCRGFGFCHTGGNIEWNGETEKNAPPGENRATATVWIENGKLVLEFNRQSMTDATYFSYFGTGEFVMVEDFYLPNEIVVALGIRSYVIQSGLYEIPPGGFGSPSFLVVF